MTPVLLLAFFLAAQDKPPERCTLPGSVVNSVSGEPINRAEIFAEPVRGDTVATTTTDGKGNFTLIDLGPASTNSKAAAIGGPASTGPGNPKAAAFLKQFLEHCAANHTPLDFIAYHAKGQPHVVGGHVQMGLDKEMTDVARGMEAIDGFPAYAKLPIVLSEADPEGCAACSARATPTTHIATARSTRSIRQWRSATFSNWPTATKPTWKACSPGPLSLRISRTSTAFGLSPPTASTSRC